MNTQLAPLVLSAVLLLPGALAAQSDSNERPLLAGAIRESMQGDPRASEQARELARGRMFDLQLAQIVTQRLTEAGLAGLTVSCVDGQVELRGQAADAEQRERAGQLALGVSGVSGVSNALALAGETAPPAEAVLVPAETTPTPALVFDQTTEPFGFATADGLAGRDVRVDVADGIARLRGEVNTTAARAYATAAAQSVPGVRAVRNELVVRRATPEESRRLALVVQRQFEYDPLVQPVAPMLLVRARDGIVRLEGVVRDDSQRAQAEQLAGRQAGVFGVDNRLEVDEDLVIWASRSR